MSQPVRLSLPQYIFALNRELKRLLDTPASALLGRRTLSTPDGQVIDDDEQPYREDR